MKIIEPETIQSIELDLYTREGNKIANTQSFFFSIKDQAEFIDLKKRYSEVEVKGKPSPIYNCHGLTFASRRTGISETEELWKIINDDRYKEIGIFDAKPGDILLYVSDDGDVWHSGIVVSEPNQLTKMPRIWSKWGKYNEVIHYANISPYNKDASNLKCYRLIEDDF